MSEREIGWSERISLDLKRIKYGQNLTPSVESRARTETTGSAPRTNPPTHPPYALTVSIFSRPQGGFALPGDATDTGLVIGIAIGAPAALAAIAVVATLVKQRGAKK